MKKAKSLLQDTAFSIQEISIMTGYKNLSNFTARQAEVRVSAGVRMKHGLSPSPENEGDQLAVNEM